MSPSPYATWRSALDLAESLPRPVRPSLYFGHGWSVPWLGPDATVRLEVGLARGGAWVKVLGVPQLQDFTTPAERRFHQRLEAFMRLRGFVRSDELEGPPPARAVADRWDGFTRHYPTARALNAELAGLVRFLSDLARPRHSPALRLLTGGAGATPT
jgi:hypothetical protein